MTVGYFQSRTKSCLLTSWSEIKFTNPPSPRRYFSFKPITDGIFLYGGYDGSYCSDGFFFDMKNFACSALQCNSIPGRFGHSIVQVSKCFYLFGGCLSPKEFCNKMYAMEFEGDSCKFKEFKHLGIAPEGRFGHSFTAVSENIICLIGGKTDSKFFNDAYLFKIAETMWMEVKIINFNIFKANAFHQTTLHKRKLIILGGALENRGDTGNLSLLAFNGQLEEFRFVKEILKIPEQTEELIKSSAIAFFEPTTKEKSTDTSDFSSDELRDHPLNLLISLVFIDKLTELIQFPFKAIVNIYEWLADRGLTKMSISSGIASKLYIQLKGLNVKFEGDVKDIFEFKAINGKLPMLLPSLFRLGNSIVYLSRKGSNVTGFALSRYLTSQPFSNYLDCPCFAAVIEGKEVIMAGSKSRIGYTLVSQELAVCFKETSLAEFILEMSDGVQFLIFDLKTVAGQFELVPDYKLSDIHYSPCLERGISINFIDCSLRQYLTFFHGDNRRPIELQGELVFSCFPLVGLREIFKEADVFRADNLKITKVGTTSVVLIEGEVYEGIIFQRSVVEKQKLVGFNENVHNGVLIYLNGKLLFRLGQNKIGDAMFLEKNKVMRVSGYVNMKGRLAEVHANQVEIADFGFQTLFKDRIHSLIKRIII